MTFYYICPDFDRPSWGSGVIYNHVKILCENNYNAFILHQKKGYKLPWLNLDVPTTYMDILPSEALEKNDILVVPEVLATEPYVKGCRARKILFIQAGAYIFEKMPANITHRDLGFEQVMVIMPHLIPIVEKFIKLPSFIIPPLIADYFFTKKLQHKREKSIIMYPKNLQVDFSIVRNLILKKIGQNKLKKVLGIDWRLKLLQDLSHKEVAQEFYNATFFISLNVFEALNTSIVEAMASGCIVFCYEGFGPRDFLKNGKNAFVFQNNEPYQLLEKLYEVLDNFEEMKPQLTELQINARKTADQYSYINLKTELLKNIQHFI